MILKFCTAYLVTKKIRFEVKKNLANPPCPHGAQFYRFFSSLRMRASRARAHESLFEQRSSPAQSKTAPKLRKVYSLV